MSLPDRDALIEHFMSIKEVRSPKWGSDLDRDDRRQTAYLALIRLIDQLLADPQAADRAGLNEPDALTNEHSKLANYIKASVRNALLQEDAKLGKAVVLDASLRHRFKRAAARLHDRRIEARPWADHSGRFSFAVIAEEAGINWDRAWHFRAASRPAESLNEPAIDRDGNPLNDLLHETLSHDDVARAARGNVTIQSDVYGSPDAGLEVRDLQRQVRTVLDAAKPSLSVDERTVLRLKWGLVDGVEKTNAEVAEHLNLSIERAKCLHDQALRKVKRGALTAIEVGEMERAAMAKVKAGAGLDVRDRSRRIVRAASCHPERPALVRGQHVGLCDPCAQKAARAVRKASGRHYERRTMGPCTHVDVTGSRCGRDAIYGARSGRLRCHRCHANDRWRDGGRLRRKLAKDRRDSVKRIA